MKNNKLRTIPSVAKRIKRNKYSTLTRLPAFCRFSLSDPVGVVESAVTNVHIGGWEDCGLGKRLAAVSPIQQAYVNFKSDGLYAANDAR